MVWISERRYLVIAKEVGDKESEGKAHGHLGIAHSSLYDFPKAFEFYQKKVSIAKQINNKKSEKAEYINLGGVYCDDVGDFRNAIAFFRQGLAIAKEVGDKETEIMAYSCLYDFSKAIEFYQKNVSIAKEVEDKKSEERVYINLAWVYSSRCDFRKVVESHQQGLAIAK